jgi:hypothetical protein
MRAGPEAMPTRPAAASVAVLLAVACACGAGTPAPSGCSPYSLCDDGDPCTVGDVCDASRTCLGGPACDPDSGCAGIVPCTGATVCCATGCADLTTDIGNCGVCGYACPCPIKVTSPECYAGVCHCVPL